MGLVYNPFGTANAVHEFVNTAYDIVRSVHENLPNLTTLLEESLSHQVSAIPPVLRADGTALQTGDTYFDGTDQYTRTDVATWIIPTTGIDLSQGLAFPAVQNPIADVNTLDDYEEGTWTPTLTGGTTNPTQSYATQVGYYTKIGGMVYINCKIAMSSTGITSGSGAARIEGLPFSAANTGDHSINIGDAQNWLTAGLGAPSSGYIGANLNFIILNIYENSTVKQSGLLTSSAVDITNNTYIVVSASYEVA